MRTNIDIDDDLMARAMQAGPYKTKREAVEAGLKLLARQAAYREILKWRGKLKWEGDESVDWTRPQPESAGSAAEDGSDPLRVQEPAPPPFASVDPAERTPAVPRAASQPALPRKSRARR
jgi:Arc/MetJ family transcription regulator